MSSFLAKTRLYDKCLYTTYENTKNERSKNENKEHEIIQCKHFSKVRDDGYSRNASCTLNLMSYVFILNTGY